MQARIPSSNVCSTGGSAWQGQTGRAARIDREELLLVDPAPFGRCNGGRAADSTQKKNACLARWGDRLRVSSARQLPVAKNV